MSDTSTPVSSIVEQLSAGEPSAAAADPVTFVIFGGGGDLAHRKLLPALYNLQLDGLLPPRVAIVGCGRGEMTDEAYRAFAKDGIERFSRRPIEPHAWELFADSLFFVSASIGDDRGWRRSGHASTSSSTSAACPAIGSTTWRFRRRCSGRR
jgi:glucose-6-phosphate 1-dehydrogenase